jgi:hypothetical protein
MPAGMALPFLDAVNPDAKDWGSGGDFTIYLVAALAVAVAAAVILAVVIVHNRKKAKGDY